MLRLVSVAADSIVSDPFASDAVRAIALYAMIVGPLQAWIPIWSGVVLYKAASGLQEATATGNKLAFEASLSHKRFFKGLIATMAVFFIMIFIVIPSLLRSRGSAPESAAVANVRTINTAEVTYLSSAGRYGTAVELIKAGLVDSRFLKPVGGYAFDVFVLNHDYLVTTRRVLESTGRFEFYSSSDGIIRYSTNPAVAREGQAGIPVQ